VGNVTPTHLDIYQVRCVAFGSMLSKKSQNTERLISRRMTKRAAIAIR
jgi:hypothetical protein